jgi:plastocyanin
VIAGLVLAGCGSGGDKKSSSGTVVHLEADDLYFKPTDLSLKAGAVTLAVKNEGKLTHNVTVAGLNVSQDLAAGKTVDVKLTPAAGTYPFHCEYHPDQMKGTITVS